MSLKESLTDQEWADHEHVVGMMLSARTLAECREARTALLAWISAHPEDHGIIDGGESLAHATDYAELFDAERRMLGFNEATGRVRESLFVRAQRAVDLDEITEARRGLLRWRFNYPCDVEKVSETLRYLDREEQLQVVIADAMRETEVAEGVPAAKNGTYHVAGGATTVRETAAAH